MVKIDQMCRGGHTCSMGKIVRGDHEPGALCGGFVGSGEAWRIAKNPCICIYELVPGQDLAGANLYGVNLEGANLERANLEGADLSGAKANEDTMWPESFDPVAAGVIF